MYKFRCIIIVVVDRDDEENFRDILQFPVLVIINTQLKRILYIKSVMESVNTSIILGVGGGGEEEEEEVDSMFCKTNN